MGRQAARDLLLPATLAGALLPERRRDSARLHPPDVRALLQEERADPKSPTRLGADP